MSGFDISRVSQPSPQISVGDIQPPPRKSELHPNALQPQRHDQADVQTMDAAPATFKSRGLKVSPKAQARLQKTMTDRAAKQKKVEASPVESRKATKSKADKFLKEFKAVFKNIGKLGKATSDGAKAVREAVVTDDMARLGGVDSSDIAKVANKEALKADGMATPLADASKVLTGFAGAVQVVETVSDFYLYNVKGEKLAVDEQTVKDFSVAMKDLDTAKGLSAAKDLELATAKNLSSAKDLELSAAQDKVLKLEGRLQYLNNAVRNAPSYDIGTDFFAEQHQVESTNLAAAKAQVTALETQSGLLKGQVTTLETESAQLKSQVATLKDKVNNSALAAKLATGDRNKFYDEMSMDFVKLYKSGVDGTKAVVDISRLAVATGTVASEALKAGGSTFGAVVGPITCFVNTKDGLKDIADNRAALKLKSTTAGALGSKGIKQDDAELLAIAERIRLKQGKQSVDKGLSASKNMIGAASGLASGFAAAATLAALFTTAATAVVAIATPIGWGLAGAAALAAIGYGVYKLARHVNSSGIKAALQTSIQTLQKPEHQGKTLGDIRGDLSSKEAKSLDRVADKLVKIYKSEGVTKSPDELTVDELHNYASKKLLARDTGVATSSLYHRFRDEVATAFSPKTAADLTDQDITTYLQAEAGKDPAESAAGLMSKLGLNLKPADALLLLNTGDKGEASALKFLGKQLRLI